MVIRGVTVIKAGEVTWPAPPIQVSAQPKAAPAAKPQEKPVANLFPRGKIWFIGYCLFTVRMVG